MILMVDFVHVYDVTLHWRCVESAMILYSLGPHHSEHIADK